MRSPVIAGQTFRATSQMESSPNQCAFNVTFRYLEEV
jgi:hypothetical protein